MQTNESLAFQPVKSFGELFCDAFKPVILEWYEGLLQDYSPRSYEVFKAAQDLKPYLLPQDRPILDLFTGYSSVVGAADIGLGVARKLQLSNPPYLKSRQKN